MSFSFKDKIRKCARIRTLSIRDADFLQALQQQSDVPSQLCQPQMFSHHALALPCEARLWRELPINLGANLSIMRWTATQIATVTTVTSIAHVRFARNAPVFIPRIFAITKISARFTGSCTHMMVSDALPRKCSSRQSIATQSMSDDIKPSNAAHSIQNGLLVLAPLRLTLSPVSSSNTHSRPSPAIPMTA